MFPWKQKGIHLIWSIQIINQTLIQTKIEIEIETIEIITNKKLNINI